MMSIRHCFNHTSDEKGNFRYVDTTLLRGKIMMFCVLLFALGNQF